MRGCQGPLLSRHNKCQVTRMKLLHGLGMRDIQASDRADVGAGQAFSSALFLERCPFRQFSSRWHGGSAAKLAVCRNIPLWSMALWIASGGEQEEAVSGRGDVSGSS